MLEAVASDCGSEIPAGDPLRIPPIDWKAPDYRPAILARIARLDLLRGDPKLLTAARIYYASHASDFIEDWIWTYDPRRVERGNGSASVPMLLWPKQRAYIQWLDERIETGTGGLVEKSRDAGATYLSLAYAVWLWLFRPGVKVGFGSRKAELVDRIGDPDSLFEKIRMMLRMLPVELLPRGFVEDQHATHMRLLNPETWATLTGEGGDNLGRGGRNTVYFVDEAAKLPHPESIDAALSQNTNIRIDISTPNGNDNPFFRKRHSGKVSIFTFHWRDDPRKDDTWYAEQKRLHGPTIVAAELDIDYDASVENVCIPAHWVRAAVDLDLPGMADGMRRAGLDVADEGEDLNTLVGVHGVKAWVIDSWRGSKDWTTTHTARKAFQLCAEQKVELLRYDKNGVGAGVRATAVEYDGPVKHEGINTGDGASKGRFEGDRLCKDLFRNLRAELWWKMRRRFEKTFQHVNGVQEFPIEELISIPNHGELISELSRPKVRFDEAGKILIESKKDMSGGSTNFADALLHAFAERRKFDLSRSIRLL